jgi:hypothetical protein
MSCRWRAAFGARALVLVLSLVCGTAGAAAQPVELLQPAEGEVYANEGPLVLRIPADLPDIDLATLQIEVDQIDVTSQVAVEGETYSLTLPAPLSPGLHLVAVLAYTTGGQFVELGSWAFQVAAPATAPRSAAALPPEAEDFSVAFESNNSVEALARVVDGGTTGKASRFGLSGAGEARLGGAGEGWELESGATYFLETAPSARLTDEPLDLGEYTTRLGYDSGGWQAGLTAGHHTLGLETFGMADFYRRGLSARGALGAVAGQERLSAQVFSFAADSQVGARDPLGLGERSGQVTGAAVTVEPLELREDVLSISGLYFGGEDAQTDFAASDLLGESERSFGEAEGTGWGLLLASEWFARRLAVEAEVARSSYDIDGDGDAEEEDATAAGLRASLEAVRDAELAGETLNLAFGAGWERVGTYFGSVANPGLAPDREGGYANSTLLWGGFYGFLEARTDANNVDDLEGLPTDRLASLAFDGQYDLLPAPGTAAWRDWIGQPFVTFGAAETRLWREETPSDYLGPDTDSELTSWYLGAGSSYDRWSWQVRHQRTDLDENGAGAGTAASSLTAATDLWVYWTVSERLTLSAGGQYLDTESADATLDGRTVTGIFGVDAVLVPRTLDLSLDYTVNLSEGGADLPDGHAVGGELTWRVREAAANRPGIEFGLRGYLDTDGGAGQEDETYEGFAVLRVLAPFAR